MKILVATEKPFTAVAVEKIRGIVEGAGYQLALLEKYTESSELAEAVADADALIVRSDIVSAELLEAASRLKIVVRAGAGYDNLDLEACTRKGIVAMNTPGQNSNAVAELTLGMMVYVARGGYDGKPGRELRGKTLGIHAYGNVGHYVAEIALGFGMNVLEFDPYLDPATVEKDGVKPVSTVEELYSSSHFISLHLPATAETKGSVGLQLLMSMPEGATLVNTARKEVINEKELLKVFALRKDFRYISDIAPDCAEEIKASYAGRYFFTPKKMGAQTEEANKKAGVAAANQIVRFLKEGDETFRVNK